jgi:hypothetical protein
MPEVHTTNFMPNIPPCSTLVTLKTKNIIPCKTIKIIKNIKFNSVKVKSLSGSCNIQVKDKQDIDFKSLWIKVPSDFSKVSCDLVTEYSYINCFNKEPEEVKAKDQGFSENCVYI